MKMPGLEARLTGRLADQGAGWPGQERASRPTATGTDRPSAAERARQGHGLEDASARPGALRLEGPGRRAPAEDGALAPPGGLGMLTPVDYEAPHLSIA
jgi:hypothetical protein